jgi:hypothetical protein
MLCGLELTNFDARVTDGGQEKAWRQKHDVEIDTQLKRLGPSTSVTVNRLSAEGTLAPGTRKWAGSVRLS